MRGRGLEKETESSSSVTSFGTPQPEEIFFHLLYGLDMDQKKTKSQVTLF